jgi:hypothetical protein
VAAGTVLHGGQGGTRSRYGKRACEGDASPPDATAYVDALADPKTVELILNADGKLWLERLGERMICIGKVAPSRAEAIIKAVAGYHNKEVTRASPVLEGEFL